MPHKERLRDDSIKLFRQISKEFKVFLCANFPLSFRSGLGTTPLIATAAMPSSTLKIYRGEPVDGRVAESVKIGDPLTMVISIDNQDIYGMHISACYVRDGLGWSDQNLINDEG